MKKSKLCKLLHHYCQFLIFSIYRIQEESNKIEELYEKIADEKFEKLCKNTLRVTDINNWSMHF